MTDQTRPMDAERLAEIRQRAEAVLAETRLGALPARGFIRKYIPDLLAEVARLGADRDAALLDVARMKDTQKDMGSLDDVLAAIMRNLPEDEPPTTVLVEMSVELAKLVMVCNHYTLTLVKGDWEALAGAAAEALRKAGLR